MSLIKSLEELEALYQPAPALASTAKVLDHISAEYRRYIEASPFVALATSGPEGLDCSPRGDDGQCIGIVNERLLALPDRRGNNRIDSLRNILRDHRVALLFLIPGSNTTFRVNGTASTPAIAAICKRWKPAKIYCPDKRRSRLFPMWPRCCAVKNLERGTICCASRPANTRHCA
jgi:uncharacterized protein